MRQVKQIKNLGRVTWNGRFLVDANRLYRMKQRQGAFTKLDSKVQAGTPQLSLELGEAKST